ncbi:MAG: MarC family protein [Desulfurococcales archaeon]|nr:MarC family protein [Desulfurococcales archaeon]
MAEVLDLYFNILVILNPFTAASVYLTLAGDDPREAHRVAIVSLALVILLGTAVIIAGEQLLRVLGIDLPSLGAGGGILLMVIAVDMITGEHKVRSVEPGELAVVPLATPMILGPGAMTVLLHLSAQYPRDAVIPAFILAALTVGVVLYTSPILRRVLGVTGVKALSKFMALLIAAVAADMIHGALVEWGIAPRG